MLSFHGIGSRNRSRTALSALLVLIVALACQTVTAEETQTDPAEGKAQLSAAEVAAGWRLLFDGETTAGWRGYQRRDFPGDGWVVEDGCLRVKRGAGAGDILTVDQFSDFDLSLEWKAAKGANSGIMFHVTEEENAPWKTGPEYQILDDAAHGIEPTDMHSSGALYALYVPENKSLKPAGEFNQARIIINDGRLTHMLNGRRLLEAMIGSDDWNERIARSKFNAFPGFGKQGKGHIDLQDHGHDVWFRNIKVRDLTQPMPGEVSLFNGRDLDGWAAFCRDGSDATDAWKVEDGLLKTMGKPIGYLYTTAKYESYVLRLEWRFNPETRAAGNGGVLLRVGDEHKVWPQSVEAQLHSTNAGDFWCIEKYPMQTEPGRTSGRNTRKTHLAERPVGEWNEYEIIVDGTDITLMVNGEVLNRAWDVLVRPGHIALQAEGSEMHFRNIRLAPIK